MKFCHLQQRGWTWHYAKRNKSEKDKHRMMSLIRGILKTQQSSENNKKEADSQIQGTN